MIDEAAGLFDGELLKLRSQFMAALFDYVQTEPLADGLDRSTLSGSHAVAVAVGVTLAVTVRVLVGGLRFLNLTIQCCVGLTVEVRNLVLELLRFGEKGLVELHGKGDAVALRVEVLAGLAVAADGHLHGQGIAPWPRGPDEEWRRDGKQP